MQSMTRQDIVTNEEYAKTRQEFRQKVLSAKKDRRVMVGDYLNFLFENRITMIYQVQDESHLVRCTGIRPGHLLRAGRTGSRLRGPGRAGASQETAREAVTRDPFPPVTTGGRRPQSLALPPAPPLCPTVR